MFGRSTVVALTLSTLATSTILSAQSFPYTEGSRCGISTEPYQARSG
jgi:hypothetical protein